jgi:DNA mismatch repair protein MutS2
MTGENPAEKQRGVLTTGVAGTPSSIPAVATAKTLEALEFAATLDIVAGFAAGELGAESVRCRLPSGDCEWITTELATASEFQQLLDSGDPFRPEACPDIRSVIERLSIPGDVLEPLELNAVRSALEAMRAVFQGLERMGDEAPLLSSLATEIPPKEIAREIDRALNPDGSVKDDASKELAQARRKLRETRARLIRLLEKQQASLGSGQRAEVTLKGGRYVIPVRRDDRDRVKGIVHGESSSGATLFVEPPAAVELGNELNAWESEEARAVLAVLRDLTGRLRPHVDSLSDGLNMCARVDDAYARARYAIEVDGEKPEIMYSAADDSTIADTTLHLPSQRDRSDSGGGGAASAIGKTPWPSSHPRPSNHPRPLFLVRARHPLLLGEADTAVPFDLALSETESTLLISGPNAGGKTVMLKTVGLIAALAQSGIIPPVAKGTTLPVYRSIFVDIGDHQSIAASLSTFSAHMAALKEVLTEADGGSLVLLDELGGGTDPIEGAALAGATLLSLNDRRCTTIATTHLSELKELAARTEGVVNASLEFDTETLAPTYRFIKDRPGRSFGLAIARRMGLPADVLQRAEELQSKEARSLEAMLADVERKDQSVTRREEDVTLVEARLDKATSEIEQLRQELELNTKQLAEREREVEREGREQARRFLLDARRRVEDALGTARAATTEATVKEARRLVEEGVSDEAKALQKLEKEGWRVKGKGEREMVGSREQAAVPDVKGSGSGAQMVHSEPKHTPTGTAPRSPLPNTGSPLPSVRSPEDVSSEIDLRGLTGDEAEFTLLLALDSAVVDGLPWFRIIHGKGTGALRVRVAQILKRDKRVAQYQLAPPQQGGSGVTVVDFVS